MLTELESPVCVGDAVYDSLSVAVAHLQSAQHFVIQGDRDAVARLIGEAEQNLRAASTALQAEPIRPLRRAFDVTAELAGRDI